MEHRSNGKKWFCKICDVDVKANSKTSEFRSTISSIERNWYEASSKMIDKLYAVTLLNTETKKLFSKKNYMLFYMASVETNIKANV